MLPSTNDSGEGDAYKPNASVILNGLVVGVGEPESVGAGAVLVVDDFGVGTRPADIVGMLDFKSAVCRDGHILRLVVLGPDDNMLPVVPVAVARGARRVFLKVVAVHVGAPAVVAARARVDVIVVQVHGVAAAALRRLGAVHARVEKAVGADGGHIVAAVSVKIEDWTRRTPLVRMLAALLLQT